jgi:hypothetical protein
LMRSKSGANNSTLIINSFQHPYLRLFVCYLVIFCNFLVFAEDPLSHSKTGKPAFKNLSRIAKRVNLL